MRRFGNDERRQYPVPCPHCQNAPLISVSAALICCSDYMGTGTLEDKRALLWHVVQRTFEQLCTGEFMQSRRLLRSESLAVAVLVSLLSGRAMAQSGGNPELGVFGQFTRTDAAWHTK